MKSLKNRLIQILTYIDEEETDHLLYDENIKNALDTYYTYVYEGKPDICFEGIEEAITEWHKINKNNKLSIHLSLEDAKDLSDYEDLSNGIENWLIIKVDETSKNGITTTYWKLPGLAASYGESEWYITSLHKVEPKEVKERRWERV